MSNRNYFCQYKMFLEGELVLKSPLLIGSGKKERYDIELLKTKEGNPFIPATTIAGVIQSRLELLTEEFADRNKLDKEQIKSIKKIWGEAADIDNPDSKQSSFIFYDSMLNNNNKKNISVRDGIAIDNKIGVTSDGAKFEYEILESGTIFDFKIEVNAKDTKEKELSKRLLKTIEDYFAEKAISVGANTNNGFGKLLLKNPSFEFYDFSKEEDVESWLKNRNKIINDAVPFTITQSSFSISFKANIDNSLIIGSTDPKVESDKTHLKSNGQAVLSGSSLKGAVRARAEKILNTISTNQEEMHKLKELLFGYIQHEFIIEKDNNCKEIVKPDKINGSIYKETKIKSLKGKLQVSENTFKEKTYTEELQHRIKIDRFTGGTIDGALFDSMPLYNIAKEEPSITFDMNIDWSDRKYELKDEKGISTNNYIEWTQYKKSAAGLLLLVLKDIWTGDLPIGGEKNVGRGRLRGVEATISWEDKEILLKEENGKLEAKYIKSNNDEPKGAWEKLEEFVSALNGLVGKS
jgi:CRISPR/Cas system CSM-associated protein Csm3 (group 7 of RAMP superfamily)